MLTLSSERAENRSVLFIMIITDVAFNSLKVACAEMTIHAYL